MRREPPQRKIIKTTKRFGKHRRYRLLAWLSCGHVEHCTAFDSNAGFLACFDCFYKKPKYWEGEDENSQMSRVREVNQPEVSDSPVQT